MFEDVFASFNRPLPEEQGHANGNHEPEQAGRGGGALNTNLARAAAWSPNPNNPPDYFDLPLKDGKPQQLIVAKWYANMPLVMVDQYVSSLKTYKALAGDVGLQDTLLNTNQQLADVLSRFGVSYKFETYEGDHTNRIPQRLATKVFPFFSENLVFTTAKKR